MKITKIKRTAAGFLVGSLVAVGAEAASLSVKPIETVNIELVSLSFGSTTYAPIHGVDAMSSEPQSDIVVQITSEESDDHL